MVACSRRIKRLVMHVCGDSGPFDELNPSFLARQRLGLELLSVLNKHPMGVDGVCSTLKIGREQAVALLNSWVKINAVREESCVYYVNFAVFTKEDLMVLAQASEKIGGTLANRISDYADKIASLAADFSAARHVKVDKLLFAALGCFILDWLGLEVLEEEKLLVKNKPQPGNRNYLLFAREEVDRNTALLLYDKMYWGSHTDMLDEYSFTSFGDHCGIRYAFPDILWTLQASPKTVQKFFKSPLWVTEKLSVITQLCSKKMLKDTACLLFRFNGEEEFSVKEFAENDALWTQNLIHLLEDMGYVTLEKSRIKLNYPVFTDGDKEIVEQIASIISPLIVQTIRQNYSAIERMLCKTTPVRNKVALNEVMNEAWHWIFAKTNKILAEKGFLYDPPKKRAEEARYIAWIAKFSFP